MAISSATESPLSIQNLFNVKGLVAVITGGGSGLGSYSAKALDENGAKAVYIVGRREPALKAIADKATNKSIIPLVGDVTDKDSLSSIVEQVRKEQGYVNFLFVNAGTFAIDNSDFPPTRESNPTIEEFQKVAFQTPTSTYDKNFNVNVTAAYYTSIAFAQLLDAGNKKGNLVQTSQILINSSVAAYARALWEYSYGPSKAASTHLAKSLSSRFSQWNIRVNAVAPGFYPSEMAEKVLPPEEIPAGQPFQGARILDKAVLEFGRSGSEEEFAGAILFLTSRAGAYINGNVLVTDGGFLSANPSTY